MKVPWWVTARRLTPNPEHWGPGSTPGVIYENPASPPAPCCSCGEPILHPRASCPCPYPAATPPLALDVEDVRYLVDAASHLADHVTSEKFHCEDTGNVKHFAAKIRARLATPPTDDTP